VSVGVYGALVLEKSLFDDYFWHKKSHYLMTFQKAIDNAHTGMTIIKNENNYMVKNKKMVALFDFLYRASGLQ